VGKLTDAQLEGMGFSRDAIRAVSSREYSTEGEHIDACHREQMRLSEVTAKKPTRPTGQKGEAMNVRAKFRVTDKEVNEQGEGSVKLEAVTSGSPENDEFFKWTPSGELSMGTINSQALAQFELGDEFYVDLVKAI